jgi:hypothetical protein
MLEYVKNQTKEICLAAYEQNVVAFNYVNFKFWGYVRSNIIIPNDILRKVGISITKYNI